MRKLTDYNEFLFNKILEELNVKVNELEFILSPRMKNVLKEMNHKIADDLLALHVSSEREYKKTFIDLGSEADKVSFISANKVPELIEPDIVHGGYKRNPDAKNPGENWGGEFDFVEDQWTNPWIQGVNHILDLHEIQFSDKNHPVWNKNRSEVKIGRFITQMFPGKYDVNVKRNQQKAKPEDVESFSNMFKAVVESKAKMIAVVTGEEIRHYYDCKTYHQDKGTLGGSCMKDSSKAHQFDMYVENPEKISMLILYPQDIRDKIIGRAILWKLSKVDGEEVKDTYFLDRIYTANDSDEYMFKEYAKAKGYYTKKYQSYDDPMRFITPSGDEVNAIVEADLKPKDFKKNYTYMDTMKYYNPETGNITNDNKTYNNDATHGVLTDYMGSINRNR